MDSVFVQKSGQRNVGRSNAAAATMPNWRPREPMVVCMLRLPLKSSHHAPGPENRRTDDHQS